MFKTFSLKTVDAFVETQQNMRWNGWTIEVFQPNKRAYYHPRGNFRDGQWGFIKQIRPNSRGLWRVPVSEHTQ